MTQGEIQKKITQVMEKLSPEQQSELLKVLSGSISNINKDLEEYIVQMKALEIKQKM